MDTSASPGGRTPPSSITGLQASGLTDVQAAAIARLAEAAACEAADQLRNEVARWHAYLALYIVSQIAIFLLATVLVRHL